MPHGRTRKRELRVDKEKFVQRALDFVDDDEQSRQHEMDMRAQRYAKYRQWRDFANDGPWAGASDVAIPDMITDSLKMTDTLFNAVISQRPVILAKAIDKKDSQKEEQIDKIVDYQAFVENKETWIDDLIDAFVNDGHFTAFTPWIREDRKVSELHRAAPIPEDVFPPRYFGALIIEKFPNAADIIPQGTETTAWDFLVTDENGKEISVSFFTDENEDVEMVVSRKVTVFDGPRPMIKDRSDVLHPADAVNLQSPSPSNPNGATHVLLRDYPKFDEIKTLKDSGRYDQLTDADMREFEVHQHDPERGEEREQRELLDGNEVLPTKGPQEHDTLTRYLVFDIIDIGDGLEDVVYYILKEPKKLLRIARLSEEFPSRFGNRPFQEATFVPVRGRRTGMGLLEMMEPGHDSKKDITDQMIDLGSMQLSPFFFYRPSSSMKPEVIRVWPGEGYPLSDPKNDVNFPNMPANGQAYGFNMLTIMDRDTERLTTIGDLQLGRVPRGKASALRTSSGIEQIRGLGEARPERILRRLFGGLAQIWQQFHELNLHFLTQEKQIRIATGLTNQQDAYQTINPAELDGLFDFEFSANVFNTSRVALQSALATIAPLYLSEIAFASGVSDARTVFTILSKVGKAEGQDPMEFINSPTILPMITVEEAVATIRGGEFPQGLPQENANNHLQGLVAFTQTDDFGTFDDKQVELFSQWMNAVRELIAQQQRDQARLQQAASNQRGQEEGGSENVPPDNSQAVLSPNELADETLPSAGGGATGA